MLPVYPECSLQIYLPYYYTYKIQNSRPCVIWIQHCNLLFHCTTCNWNSPSVILPQPVRGTLKSSVPFMCLPTFSPMVLSLCVPNIYSQNAVVSLILPSPKVWPKFHLFVNLLPAMILLLILSTDDSLCLRNGNYFLNSIFITRAFTPVASSWDKKEWQQEGGLLFSVISITIQF